MRLAAEVSKQVSGAVEQFWAEAEARGGPIVEPIQGNDRDVLVTFLWKETYETHNVLLLWAAGGADYMSSVPGTGVWYKTLRVPRSSRFTYRLSPNERQEDRIFTAQTDPLNPRVELAMTASILEMSEAPDESWFRKTPSVRGTVVATKFESALLKGQRDVSIYTPPGYEASRGPYPLVILFDGSTYLTAMDALNTFDNLIAAQRIRAPIVCFITSGDHRPDDLRLGRTFADAVATELLPWLRSSYAVSADPRQIVLGGWSDGGLAAVYIALTHPDKFGNALSQSGAFQRRLPGSSEPNSTARLYAEASKAPIRFYMDVGVYELAPSDALPRDEFILEEGLTISNRHLRDVLLAKGYDVIYRETGGAHQSMHWRATLAEGLIGLLTPQTDR